MDRDEDRDLEETAGSPVASEPRRQGVADGASRIDDVLAALSDPTRRAVLRYLRDRDVATVDELAASVAARTLETAPEGDDEERERASIELAHVHLPALAEHGFVEFDRRSSTVRYAKPPRDLEAVLRLLEELEEARER